MVGPRVVVVLGATAGAALVGPGYRVKDHLEPFDLEVGSWAGVAVATVHPSAVLRAPSPDARKELRADLIAALSRARDLAVA